MKFQIIESAGKYFLCSHFDCSRRYVLRAFSRENGLVNVGENNWLKMFFE